MKTYNNDPNFSIVLPGGCNAKCQFCFWKEENSSSNYIDELRKTIMALPPKFSQVSLTGGEPTLSPYFIQVLSIVVQRFSKIVLTTNGCNLNAHISEIKNVLRNKKVSFHVNISRHHHDDVKNNEMFGTDSIPSTNDLVDLNTKFNMIGIDVNANCVLTQEYDSKDKVREFISFAKGAGFSSIAFRKQHGDLSPSEQEEMFKSYKPLYTGICPVCYTKQQLIDGIKVSWKSSVSEPNNTIKDSVYELIVQQSGKLTSDWEGKDEIFIIEEEFYTSQQIVEMAKSGLLATTKPKKTRTSVSYSSGSGCGGRSC